MRRRTLIGIAALWMLCAAPTIAQTENPPASGSVFSEFNTLVQNNNALTLVAAGGMMFIIIIAWQGLKPLLNLVKTLQDNNKQLQDDIRRERDEHARHREAERQDWENRLKTRDTQNEILGKAVTRAAEYMDTLETKRDAEEARTTAVTELKKHITDEHTETRKIVDPIVERLDAIIAALENKEGDCAKQSGRLAQEVAAAKQSYESLKTLVETALSKLETESRENAEKANEREEKPSDIPAPPAPTGDASVSTGSDGNSPTDNDGKSDSGSSDRGSAADG